MKSLVVASLLVAACTDDGGAHTEFTALRVTSEKAQTDFSVDFGEPRFVVDVSSAEGCFEADASLGGTFRGVQMQVLQRGGMNGRVCVPARLAIAFEAVAPTDDTIEVHDADTSVTATFATGVLDIRTANFAWEFQTGNTNVMGWSHPISGTPRMSFCIPTPNGSEALRVWMNKPTGTVVDQIIHFSLPAQVEFTGSGEAMIDVDGASGDATSCTGSACTYDLEYFTIHSAKVNP
jgi:hypothetical protein